MKCQKDAPAVPRDDPQGDRIRDEAAQMRHENAMMKNEMAGMLAHMRALTEAADRRGPAHGQAPPEAAQGVQMAQNTQELSLTTPVLFYGRAKDGKSIPPNAFLMELEARQTRHGWEPSMLLRFVKSCLRGEAALWWEGCILS
jgi:hypothetical protein